MKGVSNKNLFTLKGNNINFILLRGSIPFELIKLVTFAHFLKPRTLGS